MATRRAMIMPCVGIDRVRCISDPGLRGLQHPCDLGVIDDLLPKGQQHVGQAVAGLGPGRQDDIEFGFEPSTSASKCSTRRSARDRRAGSSVASTCSRAVFRRLRFRSMRAARSWDAPWVSNPSAPAWSVIVAEPSLPREPEASCRAAPGKARGSARKPAAGIDEQVRRWNRLRERGIILGVLMGEDDHEVHRTRCRQYRLQRRYDPAGTASAGEHRTLGHEAHDEALHASALHDGGRREGSRPFTLDIGHHEWHTRGPCRVLEPRNAESEVAIARGERVDSALGKRSELEFGLGALLVATSLGQCGGLPCEVTGIHHEGGTARPELLQCRGSPGQTALGILRSATGFDVPTDVVLVGQLDGPLSGRGSLGIPIARHAKGQKPDMETQFMACLLWQIGRNAARGQPSLRPSSPSWFLATRSLTTAAPVPTR